MKWAWDPACMTFSPTFGLKQEHHSQLKDETTPAFAQRPMKCYHVSQSQVFSVNQFQCKFHQPLSGKT